MNGARVLDLVLAVILVLSFLTGAKRGLFVAIFGLVGYILGAMGGMSIAPQLLSSANSPLKRTLLTGLIVLFFASIGHIVLVKVAGAVKKVVLFGPFSLIDSILGGLISVLSVVLMIVFLATLATTLGTGNVSSVLKRSVVLGQVEQYVPTTLTTWAKDETERLLGWFKTSVPTIPNL